MSVRFPFPPTLRLAALLSLALGTLPLAGQSRIGTGAADRIYQQYCASCHGADLDGGMSGSLIDGQWMSGSSDGDIARSIREGNPQAGMPAFGEVLGEQQIRALVIYIHEQEQLADKEELDRRTAPQGGIFTSEEARFALDSVVAGEGIFWGLTFLPDGSGLVTEREGRLWQLIDGELQGPVKGIPEVLSQGQGGLLDVAPHPDYPDNGWIYLSFSHQREGAGAMTKLVRGRIEEGQWTDEETIWEAKPEHYLHTHHHFGSRFVFRDGYVFFSIGDRGRQDMAQDLSLPNGKIHRLHDDGRLPEHNPFVDREDALPSIWSYGHRNPQGMDLHPVSKEIWETEHGPRGGDEVNLIEAGVNYGWPVITYGMNYDGTPITEKTEAPDMRQPHLYWVPSIAPCGAVFYTGDAFPAWQNHFFATGLASEELHRVVIENGTVTHDEIVLNNQGRIRDIANGPDGTLYLAAEVDGGGSVIYRLRPAEE